MSQWDGLDEFVAVAECGQFDRRRRAPRGVLVPCQPAHRPARRTPAEPPAASQHPAGQPDRGRADLPAALPQPAGRPRGRLAGGRRPVRRAQGPAAHDLRGGLRRALRGAAGQPVHGPAPTAAGGHPAEQPHPRPAPRRPRLGRAPRSPERRAAGGHPPGAARDVPVRRAGLPRTRRRAAQPGRPGPAQLPDRQQRPLGVRRTRPGNPAARAGQLALQQRRGGAMRRCAASACASCPTTTCWST